MLQLILKRLRYFVVAAELSRITCADRKLHVSKPSKSVAIQQIEELTGQQLFVRLHAQGLSLPSLGRRLRNKVIHLLSDVGGLETDDLSLREGVAGELRLVMFSLFVTAFLPRLLRRYADYCPAVNIYSDDMNSADIVHS